MPEYRRAYQPGGTFFFTLVTAGRRALFDDAANRRFLHDAIAECRADRPFELLAIVLLPDHLHAIWRLPDADADFSTRWASIKARFTRRYLDAGGAETDDRRRKGGRAVWQERFWEHQIRDELDFNQHLDYVHYNPVKHRYVACPHAWPHSSFHRWVATGGYDRDWLCTCDALAPSPPDFGGIVSAEMDQ
jgi:putative transposase